MNFLKHYDMGSPKYILGDLFHIGSDKSTDFSLPCMNHKLIQTAFTQQRYQFKIFKISFKTPGLL